MIIFIRDISDSTSQKELNAFTTQGLRRTQILPFLRRGKLKMSDILRIRNLDTDRVEYHGLAYIDDDREGETLIRHLSGSLLHGKVMEVREYFPRSGRRERRLNSGKGQLAIVDRRRGDRRRKNLQIETLYGSLPDGKPPAA
jgi:hypothetical protein